jgi:hypothetical protein
LAVTQTFVSGDGSVALLTTLAHETGQTITSEIPLFSLGKGPQVFGSEVTYMRRYSYAAILNIVADEEDDGEAAKNVTAPKKAAPRQLAPPIDDEIPARIMDTPKPKSVRELLREALSKATTNGEIDAEIAKAYVVNALKFAPADKAHEIRNIISNARFLISNTDTEMGAANEPEPVE